jgi:hypothetical protein
MAMEPPTALALLAAARGGLLASFLGFLISMEERVDCSRI